MHPSLNVPEIAQKCDVMRQAFVASLNGDDLENRKKAEDYLLEQRGDACVLRVCIRLLLEMQQEVLAERRKVVREKLEFFTMRNSLVNIDL
jgi:hypothetical protein